MSLEQLSSLFLRGRLLDIPPSAIFALQVAKSEMLITVIMSQNESIYRALNIRTTDLLKKQMYCEHLHSSVQGVLAWTHRHL